MRRFGLIMLAAPALALAATPQAAADKPEASGDKQDRVICKSFAQIGSLIATNKVCKTKREWDRERSNLYGRDAIGSCAGAGGENGGICGHPGGTLP